MEPFTHLSSSGVWRAMNSANYWDYRREQKNTPKTLTAKHAKKFRELLKGFNPGNQLLPSIENQNYPIRACGICLSAGITGAGGVGAQSTLGDHFRNIRRQIFRAHAGVTEHV